jgi:hypothetical protein
MVVIALVYEVIQMLNPKNLNLTTMGGLIVGSTPEITEEIVLRKQEYSVIRLNLKQKS